MSDTKLLSNFINNNLRKKQPPLHILLSIQMMLEDGMLEVKILPRRVKNEKTKKRKRDNLSCECRGYTE